MSPQIDYLADSMDFYEEKRLALWNKYLILSWEVFSDTNIDWRESESKV